MLLPYSFDIKKPIIFSLQLSSKFIHPNNVLKHKSNSSSIEPNVMGVGRPFYSYSPLLPLLTPTNIISMEISAYSLTRFFCLFVCCFVFIVLQLLIPICQLFQVVACVRSVFSNRLDESRRELCIIFQSPSQQNSLYCWLTQSP